MRRAPALGAKDMVHTHILGTALIMVSCEPSRRPGGVGELLVFLPSDADDFAAKIRKRADSELLDNELGGMAHR